MGYTQADFETMTGAELDAVRKDFEAVGVSPAGWGKMRVSEKAAWLKLNLDDFRKASEKPSLKSRILAKAKSILGIETADKPTRKTVEHPAFRKWATPKGRQFFKVKKFAADPDPMTRQVRRQNERRNEKMPIGARQDEWHKLSGFAKVRPFMSSRRRKASPSEAV